MVITGMPDLLPDDSHAQVEEDDAVAGGTHHFYKVPAIMEIPLFEKFGRISLSLTDHAIAKLYRT